MLIHSFSTQQLISYYLREDSMDCYLTELKMLFFSNSFFMWLSVCFCSFILICYLLFVLISQVFVTFLHLVSLVASFAVINFLFSSLLIISVCKCVCSNRNKKGESWTLHFLKPEALSFNSNAWRKRETTQFLSIYLGRHLQHLQIHSHAG